MRHAQYSAEQDLPLLLGHSSERKGFSLFEPILNC